MSEEKRKVRYRGWIGVDLDGTLAEYHGFESLEHIGRPVPAMLSRVKTWLKEGQEVRIVTARVGPGLDQKDINNALRAITHWCFKHVGCQLPITCSKDYGMIELWDDRCIQVIPNTGLQVGSLSQTIPILNQELKNGMEE